MIKRTFLEIFAVSLTLCVLSCGTETAIPSIAAATLSCDLGTTVKSCIDYASVTPEATAKAACTSPGTFSSTAVCSTVSRLGTCASTTSGITSSIRYYVGNVSTADALKTACTAISGTWTDN